MVDDPARYRLQRVVEPVWRRLADNCHTTRRTDDAIAAAGFTIERMERASMRKAFPWVRPSIRGVAAKPARAGPAGEHGWSARTSNELPANRFCAAAVCD